MLAKALELVKSEAGSERTAAGKARVVRGLAVSPNGEVLASASADGTVRLWDIADHACLVTLNPRAGVVQSVVFVDDALLMSAHSDGTVAFWDLAYYDRHIEGNRGRARQQWGAGS